MTSVKELGIRQSLAWLLEVSRGFRRQIIAIAVIGILRVGASIAFIWISKRLIDIATHRAAGEITDWIVIMCVCILCQLMLSPINNRVYIHTEVTFYNSLRNRLFQHMLRMRFSGREKYHSGDIINRIENDARTVSGILTSSAPSIIITCAQFVAAAIFLIYLDVRLSVILLLIMPIMLAFSKLYFRRMRKLTSAIRDVDSRVQSHIQENIQNRALLSALEQTSVVEDAMDNLQTGLKRLVMKRNRYSTISALIVQTGFTLGYVTAFGWGVYGLTIGTVTFGMLTAFLQLVSLVQRPIVELSKQIPAMVNAFVSVQRLNELLDEPVDILGDSVCLSPRVGVKVNDVTYCYPDSEKPVLEHFSCDFPPGSMTAVYGETGVGKSTLVRLILGFITPQEGSLQLYNDRKAVEVSPLTRCNFVVVLQGNTLISGTIRDNLLMGNPSADEKDISDAIYTACADFIYRLPEGLDTQVGERGGGLSEGQAQRIAIARGLLRPGNVLLLDEPTSSLDPATEVRLMKRLSEKVRSKTVIIVTHREQTASFCDRTITLE